VTLRLARPLAWAWVAIALIDLAVAAGYLASGYPAAVLAAILTILLAIASLWMAVALAIAPSTHSLAWSGGWAWARAVLMVGGFAAVIASRLGL
jgi:hypothetical protein